MNIKRVNLDEIEIVMEIINDAKELLSHSSTQWQYGYPDKSRMINDINNKDLFGYYIGDTLAGIVALVKGLNDDYIQIYDGNWNYEASKDDLVIHRIAVKKEYHKMKIGDSLIKYAINYAKDLNLKSVKADTHIKNIAMQKLLTDNKFKYMGNIYLLRDELDNKRLAYELDIIH